MPTDGVIMDMLNDLIRSTGANADEVWNGLFENGRSQQEVYASRAVYTAVVLGNLSCKQGSSRLPLL
jgi:hypothetical protein